MSSSYSRDPFATAGRPPTNTAMAGRMTASASATGSGRPSTAGRYNDEESWVEIASQPSSSSLSSIADEIVTTGLRVGFGPIGPNGGSMPTAPQRRRRLLQQVDAAAEALTATAPPDTRAAGAGASVGAPVTPRDTGSSQDEYDETESEEDRLMSSSTEHVHVHHPPTPPQTFALLQQRQAQSHRLEQRATASDGDDEEDDDDDGTALGIMPRTSSRPPRASEPPSQAPTFRPQPNAFSHPPSHLQQQQQQQQQQRSLPTPPHLSLSPAPLSSSSPHQQHQFNHSSFPASATTPLYPRTSSSLSQRSQTRAARSSGPGFMSPAHREDNDAALRASLTTLLSCAAAARGLPKRGGGSGGLSSSRAEDPAITSGIRTSTQPLELRLVPEADLMSETPERSRPSPAQAPAPVQAQKSSTRESAVNGASASAAAAAAAGESKSKRSANSAGPAGNTGKSPRAIKKKRMSSLPTATSATVDGETAAATTFITPTLLTWVVSAGVVVLVSVVGFGAGFVIGREVGRQEGTSVMAASSGGFVSSGSGAAEATSSCGREILRSSSGGTLRRFQWGAGMTKSIMA